MLRELYAPFLRTEKPFLVMSPESAEMTKYVANAMLATKISFINEMANLCERMGADINDVRRGIGHDAASASASCSPGVGYGGSCFPKDVRALVRMARSLGVPTHIVGAGRSTPGLRRLWESNAPRNRPRERNWKPMRWSWPMPRRTSLMSAPQPLAQVGHLVDEADLGGEHGVGHVLGHFGASGDMTRNGRSVRRNGASSFAQHLGASGRRTPTTTRSGFMKSSIAAPSLRNSGLLATSTCRGSPPALGPATGSCRPARCS